MQRTNNTARRSCEHTPAAHAFLRPRPRPSACEPGGLTRTARSPGACAGGEGGMEGPAAGGSWNLFGGCRDQAHGRRARGSQRRLARRSLPSLSLSLSRCCLLPLPLPLLCLPPLRGTVRTVTAAHQGKAGFLALKQCLSVLPLPSRRTSRRVAERLGALFAGREFKLVHTTEVDSDDEAADEPAPET